VRTAGLVLLAGLASLVAWPALAQDDPKPVCRIPRFRGATAPGGATVDVTVVNTGKPCRIRMHSDVDAGMATTELHAVEEPQHGRLELSGPDVANYIPNPGYTGRDQYAVAGRGPTARGTTASVRVNVRVTVVNP
jgi:hypothetical protein